MDHLRKRPRSRRWRAPWLGMRQWCAPGQGPRRQRALGLGLRVADGGGSTMVSRATEEREGAWVRKIAKCGERERWA
jgi:hypothetical protein